MADRASSQTLSWSAPAARLAESTANDLQLVLRVRKSLLQDDKLAPHIVGVTVHEQVATLWGSVPSGELSERAEQRTRQIIGLRTVRNELHVAISEADSAIAIQRPTRLHNILFHPNTIGLANITELGKISEPTAGRPVQTWQWRPAQTVIGSSDLIDPESRKDDRSRPRGPELGTSTDGHGKAGPHRDQPVVVLQAIQAEPAYASRERPHAVLSSTLRLPDRDPLAESIEWLQRSKPAYRNVTYRVSDGIVYLTAPPARAAERFAFAQAVSHLAGVKRVVLDDLPNKSRS